MTLVHHKLDPEMQGLFVSISLNSFFPTFLMLNYFCFSAFTIRSGWQLGDESSTQTMFLWTCHSRNVHCMRLSVLAVCKDHVTCFLALISSRIESWGSTVSIFVIDLLATVIVCTNKIKVETYYFTLMLG